MKIFTCTDFVGHYPVGTAAVILAPSKEGAETKLREHLASIGLPQEKPVTRTPLALELEEITTPGVYVPCNGDY